MIFGIFSWLDFRPQRNNDNQANASAARFVRLAAMPNYNVIAERVARRAGRSEDHCVGHISADSLEQAERLARETFPGLRLRVTERTIIEHTTSPRAQQSS
jgi:hypothetical protein